MLLLLANAALTIASPLIVQNVRAVADRYDAFLLDQFGVLHDGSKPLPGAIECFAALAAANKKLVVLSNTSRRRSHALKKLPALGFDDSALAGFLTSGEAAWEHLASHRRGQRVLWISWADDFHAWDAAYLRGLDLTLADATSADFVLLQGSQVLRDGGATAPASTGVFATGEPSAALRAALDTCAARGLEMICANPDFTVTLPDGSCGHMPGAIAAEYERRGGRVTYYGKPHLPAFEAALRLLGPGTDPSRVCHVGDSLLHASERLAFDLLAGQDVAGAAAAGVDSIFVAGGIHAVELGVPETGAATGDRAPEPSGLLTPEALERLFGATGARPTQTVEAFVW